MKTLLVLALLTLLLTGGSRQSDPLTQPDTRPSPTDPEYPSLPLTPVIGPF